MTIEQAQQHLQSVPRISLGFFPTPLYKLSRLSDALGIELYIKRDDFSGKNLFGGNKTRKLEYILGKALQEKCEYVFTYGATQSNHAMQTTWAAVANGLKPVLYLTSLVETDENEPKANMLLDRIFGAEVHLVLPNEGESFLEAEERSYLIGEEHIRTLEAEGHRCMNIPMGGADPVGTAGYVRGMVELCSQAAEMGIQFDYLYHATGSGGTMAGLVAGKKILNSPTKICSIAVLDTDEHFTQKTSDLANDALRYLGIADADVQPHDFTIETEFYAPGYELPNAQASKAIRLLAQTEGLLVDPVYSGKALSGLISDIQTGRVPQGSKVVFLHTGGATSLFAEKAILGDIIETDVR